MRKSKPFNIVAVVQKGRLGYEALLLAASLRKAAPDFKGKLLFAEPSPGALWPDADPRLPEGPLRARLNDLGAEFVPFSSNLFGARYPYGNKIEMLEALPPEPFLFLDTDTLITGDIGTLKIDFTKPSASMRREGTWPKIEPYGPGYGEIWQSLYTRFGLDFKASLDESWPDEYWRRYLYFNAGWFCGENPVSFGQKFREFATEIHRNPPEPLICQELWPWLDQIALPLVIRAFGGGRPDKTHAGLDGALTCHYRTLPLLYARESDQVIAVLEEVAREKENRRILRDWAPLKEMVYLNRGKKARALFDQEHLPKREQIIRNGLKREGLWLR